MNLTDFIQRLQSARKSGSGFVAKCPSHSDQHNSLSVTEKDGKILVKCFAGCDVRSIVSAVGLIMSDLFEARTNGFYVQAPHGSRKVVAVYQYVDEQGDIIYENVRYEPKDFRQRRPDGKGSYIWNLQGIRAVPYRLPELIKAAKGGGQEVWLCEGEKDADALRSLGFTASSFKNWQSTFNQYVRAAHVVLFQDHDAAGEKQASDAAKLLSGDVASLKLIDLFADEPLPQKHGRDVSDYIRLCRQDEGLTDDEIAERICEIVDRADTWNAPDQQGTDDEQDAGNFSSLFLLKPANDWIMEAKQRPVPRMLFDEFWFEGELCILFADTGKGKSILAVQIGESIASGRQIDVFQLSASAQSVLYFDFELSDKQFETRYSEKSTINNFYMNHFRFSPNFYRAEINPDAMLPQTFKDFEEYLNFSLEYHLAETDAKILIVDNLTYLRSETERAKDALPLMKELKRLKAKFDLSILALAHTPKRDLSKPITVNDLQGSKMLSNFADNIFAIGESHKDHNVRYLKQIKPRSAELKYGAENVCICQVEKPNNFLQFQFLDFGKEREHLREISEKDRDALIQKAIELHNQGKTQREIASELGISLGAVNKYLKVQNTSQPVP